MVLLWCPRGLLAIWVCFDLGSRDRETSTRGWQNPPQRRCRPTLHCWWWWWWLQKLWWPRCWQRTHPQVSMSMSVSARRDCRRSREYERSAEVRCLVFLGRQVRQGLLRTCSNRCCYLLGGVGCFGFGWILGTLSASTQTGARTSPGARSVGKE